jgi:DNA-binding MarR family transcriptional regulator
MSTQNPQGEPLVHLLAELERRVFRLTTLQARESALTLQQFLVLDCLKERGACKVSELQAALGVAQSTTSEITSRMTRVGLLTKRRDPKDQRALILELTSKGREAFKTHQNTARGFYKKLLGEESTTNQGLRSALEALLRRLPKSIKAGED